MPTITGTSGNDVLAGTAGDDDISGLGSSDYITGGDGADVILGGDEFTPPPSRNPGDYLDGGAGNDTLYGGVGDDSITGGLGSDLIFGGDGNDDLYGYGSISDIGLRTLIVQTSAGAASYPYYSGTILYPDDDDGSVDTFDGGAGNDVIHVGLGDIADGGSGIDHLLVTLRALSSGVTLDLSINPALTIQAVTGGSYSNFESYSVRGTLFDDVITGGSDMDILYGDTGNDTLRGGLNVDTLTGGAGSDLLEGGAGNDVLIGSEYAFNLVLPNGETGARYDDGVRDVLLGGDGDDTIYAGMNDQVDGGAGNDTIQVSLAAATSGVVLDLRTDVFGALALAGNMTFANVERVSALYLTNFDDVVYAPQVQNAAVYGLGGNDILYGDDLAQTLDGNEGDDVLDGQGGSDTLRGGDGSDQLFGGAGNDSLSAGSGSDFIDGGEGNDILVLTGRATDYYFEQTATGWLVYDGANDVDTVTNVERVQFPADAPGSTLIESAAAASFDAYRYIAGYADLIRGYGSNPAAGYQHYISNGQAEGRSPMAFSGLTYVASNVDLIGYLGTNQRAAAQHYVQNGFAEGRATASFSGITYVASNTDLIASIGSNEQAAAQHYITQGYSAGRPVSGFNALLYSASNADLARSFGTDVLAATRHYVEHGFSDGKATTGFDALLYIASNSDLAHGLGLNAAAGLNHYLTSGADEGRDVASFDPRLYAASSTDLAQFLGADRTASIAHWIEHGVVEGRAASGFDAVGYLLANTDLAGLTASQALDHWLTTGADQGRSGDALFGRDQISHTFSGSAVAGTIEQASDRDWFSLSLTAGQTVTLDAGSGTLADAFLSIYDATGHLLAFDNNSGPGLDARLTFTADAAGAYYMVVGSNSGAGTYAVYQSSGTAGAIEPDLKVFDGHALADDPWTAWADDHDAKAPSWNPQSDVQIQLDSDPNAMDFLSSAHGSGTGSHADTWLF